LVSVDVHAGWFGGVVVACQYECEASDKKKE
jgi:hypothetical protein